MVIKQPASFVYTDDCGWLLCPGILLLGLRFLVISKEQKVRFDYLLYFNLPSLRNPKIVPISVPESREGSYDIISRSSAQNIAL